jgi:ribosome-associated protein
MADVRINRRVTIPEAELEFRASRSSGPGGQGVNTTASKIELRFDVDASPSLSERDKQLIHERLGNRITDDGVLILQSSEQRSQHQNREAAVARLQALVSEAIQPPKHRRRTRPTRASKERRLEAKKRRGEKKRLRKPPPLP